MMRTCAPLDISEKAGFADLAAAAGPDCSATVLASSETTFSSLSSLDSSSPLSLCVTRTDFERELELRLRIAFLAMGRCLPSFPGMRDFEWSRLQSARVHVLPHQVKTQMSGSPSPALGGNVSDSENVPLFLKTSIGRFGT